MNVGERIGDYEIIEVLGAGGMGQVFRVRNTLSERIEAIKVLLPNLEGDPELADRFLREIKVQATLDHPNIAQLHTALRASNQLLMVMEFVDGISIEKMLENGALPVREAAGYASQVLDALAYAHARGVVHRDIKPANIMVTPAGVVKLMDFGIARVKAERKLTQTGRAVGSLYYMSPEQIRGGESDTRSDLYSLGVTLYEMVTGRRPFQGDSDYSIMAAHLQQTPPPPVEIVPGVPGDLSEIIVMAMAKDPANRFQSAQAFNAALKGAGTAPASSPVKPVTHTLILPPPLPAAAPPPLVSAAVPAAQPPSAFAPVSAPPPMAAQYTPVQKPSRRGLYMALGSVATLLVLVAAVVEGPKFLHAGANDSQSVAAPETSPASAPAAPEPALVPAPSDQVPAQQQPVQAATPPEAPPPPPATPPAKRTPPPPQLPVAVQPPPQEPPVAQQTPPPPPPAQPPPPPVRANPELNQLREDYNSLSIRAGTAKSGLRSIEQQMARQGLGLRGDIREAETRLDYQMKEAMDSIRAGDLENARRNLQMAGFALQTIEKFLGR